MPSALQSSLRHQMNKNLRKDDLSVRVKGVTCVEEGRQKAECLAESTDGTSENISVVISADGDTYVSK